MGNLEMAASGSWIVAKFSIPCWKTLWIGDLVANRTPASLKLGTRRDLFAAWICMSFGGRKRGRERE